VIDAAPVGLSFQSPSWRPRISFMIPEHDTREHAGSREGKNPLQMSLFGAGSDDEP